MTQRFLSAAKYVMEQINPSNLSGAIDVVVVEQEDGSLLCSPFHVRFGKLGTLVAEGRPVDVYINDRPAPELQMKLGSAGAAFFVEERWLGANEEPPCDGTAITSPITSDQEEDDDEEEEGTGDVSFSLNTPKRRRGRRVKSNGVAGGSVETPAPSPQGPNSPLAMRCFSDDDVCSAAAAAAAAVADADDEPGVQGQRSLADSSGFLSDTALDQAGADTAQVEGLTWQWGQLPLEEQIRAAVKRKRRRRRRQRAHSVAGSLEVVRPRFVSETDSCVGDEDEDEVDDDEGEAGEDGTESDTSSGGLELAAEMRSAVEAAAAAGAGAEAAAKEAASAPCAAPEAPSEEEGSCAPPEAATSAAAMPEPPDGPVTDSGSVSDAGSVATESTVVVGDSGAEAGTTVGSSGPGTESGAASSGDPAPVYLSEVIERPELRDLYVYGGGRPPEGPAARDGAASPVDQGYRSDGEGSAVPASPSGASSPGPGRVEEEEAARLRPVHLSLCGMGPPDAERFHAHMVLYEEFCRDPDGVLANPDLMVQLHGRFYTWPVAAPLLVASLVYQCELPPRVVDRLEQKQQARRESKRRPSVFTRLTGWGRTKPSEPAVAAQAQDADQAKDSAGDATGSPDAQRPGDRTGGPSGPTSDPSTAPDTDTARAGPPAGSETLNGRDPALGPTGADGGAHRVIHVKTLRLSSERLHRLRLQPGTNRVEYLVTSQFQGTARCEAQIFLWRWTDRVVVSDIDGTITQSDVMGQLGPFLGRDVSQRGVAGLYSGIAKNNYRLLYLSSRAIGQAQWTRSYLQSVVQERGLRLPDGPLLLSPTSLFYALVREIRNRPEDFKIPCLRDIRTLFPADVQPFYAGFGNKANDVRSYQAVDIVPERIFVVDRFGALRRQSHVSYRTNYSGLGELVNHFFPEVEPDGEARTAESEETASFETFAYWRDPVPTVDEAQGATAPTAK